MSMSDYVHLDVDVILRVTDAAMLLRIGDEEVWIPLSQIADAEDYEAGDVDITVTVTRRIANQKGLE